jgi:hypothetical protein
MTTFYSTKVHRKVAIPENKVCGYTMTSHANKRGRISGVRAGKDNGVVPQRLSRFATKHDADERFACAGNTNWRNDEIEFHQSRGGRAFNIARPGFRAGASIVGIRAEKLKKNIRNGLGNRDITRPNFTASKILPRQHTDFDKLQAMDIANQGEKVRLADETLEALLTVNIPDATDLKWLNEKARLTAQFVVAGMNPVQIARELAVNKPLGREQRTTKGKRNIGEASLSMGQKLDELQQEVKDGRAESRLAQAAMAGHIANILADTQRIDQLTQLQLRGLGAMLARLDLPRTPKQMGLEARFVDIEFYNGNAGIVNLYFFSALRHDPLFVEDSTPGHLNYLTPIKNFAASDNGLPSVRITTMVSAMGRAGRDRRYLDLRSRGILSRAQMRNTVRAMPDDFDNPDVSIEPEHR